jgi:cytidyltransferase-like protein
MSSNNTNTNNKRLITPDPSLVSTNNTTPSSCSLLELIPSKHLQLPDKSLLFIQSNNTTNNESSSEIESHRWLINAKLVEVAIQKCTTNALDVLISPLDLRGQISNLYNDLWDAQLMHNKTYLTCRIITTKDLTTTIQYETIFNIGSQFHQGCIVMDDLGNNQQHTTKITLLHESIMEELLVPYILYDNPSQPLPHLRKIALGGTFDRMHNGHRKLLTVAAAVASEVIIIGITSSLMLASKKNASQIEPIETRCQNVQNFLDLIIGKTSLPLTTKVKVEIVVIDDPWGPAIVRPDLDGIVASSETIKGVRMINEQRIAKQMNGLIPVIVSRSMQYTLSSTFLRNLMLSKG